MNESAPGLTDRRDSLTAMEFKSRTPIFSLSPNRTGLAAIPQAISSRIRGSACLLAYLCLASAGASAGIKLDKPVDAFRITTPMGVQITPAGQRGRILVIK